MGLCFFILRNVVVFFTFAASMLDQFKQELSKLNIHPSNSLGVAISGGIDSIVLLHLLLKSGFQKILLLHVNYGLRNEESNEDEKFVANLAKDNNINIEILNAKNQITSKTGIQEKAREIRYQWFNIFIKNGKIDFILTAHQQDDFAETVLLNLFRKTGIKGLTGIHQQTILLRPLLSFSRNEIEHYALKHNLKWRTDSSNLKSDYARNFIRNEIIPNAQLKFPNIIQNVSETAQQLGQEHELLKELIEKQSNDLIIKKNQHISIFSLTKIRLYSQAALLLHYLLSDYGFNYVQTEEMLLSSIQSESGKKWESKLYNACTSHDNLWVLNKSLPVSGLSKKWHIGDSIEEDFVVFSVSTKNQINEENTLFLDSSYHGKEIEMRFWKLGDKILISQQKQSKKLSDLFTENKIPILLRELIPVFLIDNQIVWVAGVRVSSLLNNQQVPHTNLFISVKALLL